MTPILDVYRRYGVQYVTDGSKVTEGWAGVRCPFCHSGDYHLGVHLTRVYWSCWKCGPHRATDALAALCGVGQAEALALWREVSPFGNPAFRDRDAQRRIAIHPYRQPSGIVPLGAPHRRYLEGRGFDPDKIAAEWGIVATGPTSYLDDIDYRHRILIPIAWEGREVSFTARDYTGRAELRYKSCPADREIIHHKSILYGHPRCFERRVGICVEGPTDAWRLGDCAFALFGIAYLPEQVAQVIRRFDRVAVVFDGGEKQPQRQARRLASRLCAAGVDARTITLPSGDPGSLSPDDARALVREAMGSTIFA